MQDVTPGSPGARAGLRTYDVIVAVDGKPIDGNDALIQLIAARQPGSIATVQVLRDGRSMNVTVKLAERPQRDRREPDPAPRRCRRRSGARRSASRSANWTTSRPRGSDCPAGSGGHRLARRADEPGLRCRHRARTRPARDQSPARRERRRLSPADRPRPARRHPHDVPLQARAQSAGARDRQDRPTLITYPTSHSRFRMPGPCHR